MHNRQESAHCGNYSLTVLYSVASQLTVCSHSWELGTENVAGCGFNCNPSPTCSVSTARFAHLDSYLTKEHISFWHILNRAGRGSQCMKHLMFILNINNKKSKTMCMSAWIQNRRPEIRHIKLIIIIFFVSWLTKIKQKITYILW